MWESWVEGMTVYHGRGTDRQTICSVPSLFIILDVYKMSFFWKVEGPFSLVMIFKPVTT